MDKKAVLCLNIGTPVSPKTSDVRAYLREFLSDPRVIDIPYFFRKLLLNLFILPFRSPKSAHAYRSIWTEKGSPLLLESEIFVRALQKNLGSSYLVKLGMRYGEPSLKKALEEVKDFNEVILFPLFPQYASSSTASCLEASLRFFASRMNIPSIKIIGAFYKEEGFIQALGEKVLEAKKESSWDHLLMSYHGLPERQVKKSEFFEGDFCLSNQPCPINFKETFCYRKQCYETSFLLAKRLGLKDDAFTVSFQSRLGRTPWIKPYTDEMLPLLRKKGIKNLAVICPSFVADCLETLEEINIRARDEWMKLGGETFTFISCVNDNRTWIQFCSEKIKALN